MLKYVKQEYVEVIQLLMILI